MKFEGFRDALPCVSPCSVVELKLVNLRRHTPLPFVELEKVQGDSPLQSDLMPFLHTILYQTEGCQEPQTRRVPPTEGLGAEVGDGAGRRPLASWSSCGPQYENLCSLPPTYRSVAARGPCLNHEPGLRPLARER